MLYGYQLYDSEIGSELMRPREFEIEDQVLLLAFF